MKQDQDARSERGYRLPVNCFRCSEGCVHLEYGNIVFTFTPPQFRALAEAVCKVYGEMQAGRAEEEFTNYAESIVM
ncbi:MAG TPA: hypothetical protein VIM99_13340 [Blastocatellia bacterium]